MIERKGRDMEVGVFEPHGGYGGLACLEQADIPSVVADTLSGEEHMLV